MVPSARRPYTPMRRQRLERATSPVHIAPDQSSRSLQPSRSEVYTNNAESFFSRMRRGEIGHHHHVAGPYLDPFRPRGRLGARITARSRGNGFQVDRLIETGDGKSTVSPCRFLRILAAACKIAASEYVSKLAAMSDKLRQSKFGKTAIRHTRHRRI